jgi:hypothetical protein
MCVSGVLQANSTTQYTLTVKQPQVGWMAMLVSSPSPSTCRSPISNSGFGSQMVNTPMVLMWRDPPGKAVLSQRQTSQYVMPQVVSNPSRVATALQYKTSTTSSQTSLSFEIPSASGSRTIIWAYSQTAPSTPSDPGSTITQHDDRALCNSPSRQRNYRQWRQMMMMRGVPHQHPEDARGPRHNYGHRPSFSFSPSVPSSFALPGLGSPDAFGSPPTGSFNGLSLVLLLPSDSHWVLTSFSKKANPTLPVFTRCEIVLLRSVDDG